VINSLFAIIDFTTTQVASIIPDWTAALTFNTDGTAAGAYCKHPDTDGKIRIFETKTDGNINHEPPTNPVITEDTYWKEVSSSAGAAIPEWAAGIYGPGLIIVYHNHSVDGDGLYILKEPVRPFASADIEAEITALKWAQISGGTSIEHFKGLFASYAALSSAFPAADPGDYAFVDAGAANDVMIYIWDDDDADWILGGASATPNASETVSGSAEEATDAETAAGTAVGGTGAKLFVTPAKLATWWTAVKAAVITFAAQITFTSAPRFSSTTASQFLKVDASKDLESVAAASQSEAVTGTNDTKPMTPLSSENKTSVKRATASVSAGTCTLNCNNKETIRFEDTSAQSSNYAVALSNETVTELIEYNVPITGTLVITFPSSVVMTTIDARWNNSTKQLTLTGTTASPFCLILSRISSTRFELVSSYPFYAS